MQANQTDEVRNAEEHNVAAVRDLIDAFFGSLFDIGPGSSSPVSLYRQVLALNHLTSTVCEETVKLGIWNRIARGQVKFDVVVMTPFFCECLTPVVDVVNASLIYLSTPGSFYDLTVDVTGFREPLSFCPNMMLPFTDRMSFAERGVNLALTLQTWLMRSVADAVLGDFRQDLADKIFKGMNVRSISEVQRDASLIFIGTPAVGVSTSRPSMPQTIQVGGMNLKEPKPLTQVRVSPALYGRYARRASGIIAV
ncbi:unnamed protein product [Notodromas monacha]|uniref:Uncharacterized protein n=1 Tax=Notodromas monacha TaxID=399045 RepID=A0A7R9BY46_9CRUS|nr:unnamed protein product [Notodromas monacha]CAG0922577.1 unnamed protein product [Notodromas monacha]